MIFIRLNIFPYSERIFLPLYKRYRLTWESRRWTLVPRKEEKHYVYSDKNGGNTSFWWHRRWSQRGTMLQECKRNNLTINLIIHHVTPIDFLPQLLRIVLGSIWGQNCLAVLVQGEGRWYTVCIETLKIRKTDILISFLIYSFFNIFV